MRRFFLTTLVVCKMPFSFGWWKFILINLFKTNNIAEVRRLRRREFKTNNIAEVLWRREFRSTPPRLTISRLRDKFNNDGTVKTSTKGGLEDIDLQLTRMMLKMSNIYKY